MGVATVLTVVAQSVGLPSGGVKRGAICRPQVWRSRQNHRQSVPVASHEERALPYARWPSWAPADAWALHKGRRCEQAEISRSVAALTRLDRQRGLTTDPGASSTATGAHKQPYSRSADSGRSMALTTQSGNNDDHKAVIRRPRSGRLISAGRQRECDPLMCTGPSRSKLHVDAPRRKAYARPQRRAAWSLRA
jgi:hypothetical protein